MRYKGILMDADDTIFDFQTANRTAVGLMMDELGYTHPDRFEQYEVINLACWKSLENGQMTQAALMVARWTRFLMRYNIDADDRATADRFAELLGMQAMMLPHAEETVRRIAAERPVWILTNGITEIQKARMSRCPLRDVISGMVISQEIGVAKPDPEIFRIALDRMGLDPRDVLMIGDGPASDVLGANRAGVDVCFYNAKGLTLPDGAHAEYTVTDIRDCVDIALQ